LLFAFLSAATCFAGAAQYSTNYPACPPRVCSPHALAWSAGEFDQIYLIQQSENSAELRLQPQQLVPEVLAQALRELKGGEGRPLFDEDGAATFAQGLVITLGALGTPGEQADPKPSSNKDALFLVTTSLGLSGLFGNSLGNSGRAFVDSKGLNLIFGEVGVDFIGPYHGVGKVRSFEFGSRLKASHVRILVDPGGIARLQRSDWIVIPLKPLKQGSITAPSESFKTQRQRLQRLKQLLKDGLITEQEYEAKKAEILKEL
jgi:hypothetical protein